MYNRYETKPYAIERIVSALSYMTSGLIGFVWLILGVLTKSSPKPFMKYHIFQSIFLAIGFFLFSQFFGIIFNILSFIPFVGGLILKISFYFMSPLLFGYSIVQVFIFTVLFYLVVTSLQGRYSYLPWISEIIRANVRNS